MSANLKSRIFTLKEEMKQKKIELKLDTHNNILKTL